MKKAMILSLCLAASTLTACSSGKQISLDSQESKFISAKSIPTLKMPPGVNKPKYASSYPIPKRHYSENGAAVNIVPPGIAQY